MPLFEYLGELFHPGPLGQVDLRRGGPPPERSRRLIALRFAIALALVLGFEYLTILRPGLYDWHHVLRMNAFLVVYLALGGLLRIQPAYENTGWVPFLIDNPFRISDDWNRLLVFFSVVLLPGRYVVSAVGEGVRFYFCPRR